MSFYFLPDFMAKLFRFPRCKKKKEDEEALLPDALGGSINKGLRPSMRASALQGPAPKRRAMFGAGEERKRQTLSKKKRIQRGNEILGTSESHFKAKIFWASP